LILDGSSVNQLQYARLYNFVLSLPLSQRPAYSARATSNNFCKYSASNGTEFYIPNRRMLYARMNDSDEAIPGTYYAQQIKAHKHIGAFNDSQSGGAFAPFGRTNQFGKPGSGSTDFNNDLWFTNDGTEIAGANQLNDAGLIGIETRPNSYSINKYVLI
jgi:hypothetical protein